jgi:uncharacterized membrane protein YeaQ/YmgE (transglycosylase-associated protein family)
MQIMSSLLGTLIIGLIVGALAKLIGRGEEPSGYLITMAIGVAGSFVGFYLGRRLLGLTGPIPSLIGAIVLLLIYHWIRRRKR